MSSNKSHIDINIKIIKFHKNLYFIYPCMIYTEYALPCQTLI